MESLIGLVNRIQRACTALGDHGDADGGGVALPTLWEALPSVAVVGGQVTLHDSFGSCLCSSCMSPIELVLHADLRTELREVFRVGEHRMSGLPTAWFWCAIFGFCVRLFLFVFNFLK